MIGVFIAQDRPFQQPIERGAERLAPVGQAAFNVRWHLRKHDAPNNTVSHHLSKLLGKHLLRDRRIRPFVLGEAQQLAGKQAKQEHLTK